MTLSLTANGVPGLLLPPIVDLAYASQLKAVLVEALDLGKGLVVDAGEVQRISTPCLQVLAAAAKSFALAGEASLALVISEASEAFSDAVTTLAISSEFTLKESDG